MIRRRAVILPVVLLILVLLGLLVAMFSFRVSADVASTQAIAFRTQTRLAAEAGVDRVKMLLRTARFDVDQWYDNPDDLHRIIVWMEDGDRATWGTNDEFSEPRMAYRFSIVADNPTDYEDLVRFGITDEASKLNLNKASEKQLLTLVRHALGDDAEAADPFEIVNAIIDWRDTDHTPRGEAGDTEGIYYRFLPKPYRVKNAPYDTVEELLLVKGVTAELLYGEDFDRNGLLTRNEDDGDETFPDDNEDGALNQGLYPYLTVFSSEENVSNANRPRVYLLNEDATELEAQLAASFPDEPSLVDFIVKATRPRQPSGGNTGNEGEGDSNPENEGDPPGESGEGDPEGEGGGPEGAGNGPSTGGVRNGGQAQPPPIVSPASLLKAQTIDGNLVGSPLSEVDLPRLMDLTTVLPAEQQTVAGLINVNTAPRLVLSLVPGLSEEHVDGIIGLRDRLAPDSKMTTAWLVVEGLLDLETYEAVSPYITARGQQFTIESLGYGDLIGMVTRLQVVVDMVGPIVETVYYRDVTYVGGHFPIREEDLERVRAR